MFYDIGNYNLMHSVDQWVKSHHVSGQILDPSTEHSSCTYKKGLRLCFSLLLSAQMFCTGNRESGACSLVLIALVEMFISLGTFVVD